MRPTTISKLVPGLAALCLLLSPPPAHAEDGDSPFSGFLLAYSYINAARVLDGAHILARDHGDADWLPIDRAGLRFQLRVTQSFTPDVFMDASLNVEYAVQNAERGPLSGLGDGMSIEFKEGYLSLGNVLPRLDVKIGRQYIFWGRFEWGGVEDVVSAWDFRNLGAEKENFRQGVDALRFWVDLSPVTIEGLVIGYARPNRVALDLPDQIGPLAVIQNDAVVPGLGIENVETGARVSVTLGRIGEVGVAWFRGFQRTFSLSAEVIPDEHTGWPAALSFTPRYDRHQMLAGDFEFVLGREVMLLGEVGMFFTADPDGDDVFVTNDHIRGVVGVEWEPTGRFRLQAQAGVTYLLDYDRQQEFDARLALGEPDPYVPGALQFEAFYKLQWQVLDELGLHFLHLINFPDSSTNDMMVLFFVAWEPVQALKLYSGLAFFRGAEDTRFGRIEGQSQFFFELKHSF